jgi:glycosyltransferase involved in cell wall biosynthesis
MEKYLEKIRREHSVVLGNSGCIIMENKLNFDLKASVVIPMLNEEKNIGATIKSIRGSNIIVIDNGSSDDSVEIVKREVNNNPALNIVLLKESQKGVAFARELGASYLISQLDFQKKDLHTQYLLSTDADTVVNEKWATNYVEFFDKDDNIDIASGDYLFYKEYLEVASNIRSVVNFLYTGRSLIADTFKAETGGANFAIRAEAFCKIGGFRQEYDSKGKPKWGEDVDIGLKGILLGLKEKFIINTVHTSPRRLITNSFIEEIARNVIHKPYKRESGMLDFRTEKNNYTKADDTYFFLKPIAKRIGLSYLIEDGILKPILADYDIIEKDKTENNVLSGLHESLMIFSKQRDYFGRYKKCHADKNDIGMQMILDSLKKDASYLYKRYSRKIRKNICKIIKSRI